MVFYFLEAFYQWRRADCKNQVFRELLGIGRQNCRRMVCGMEKGAAVCLKRVN